MNDNASKNIIILDMDCHKKKCSLKSIFSCCIDSFKLKKSDYINKWKNYIKNYIKSKHSTDDPFAILTKLWAHENIISSLAHIRINPKLDCSYLEEEGISINIRNDLEFYIPQLCLFILFGEFELVEELLSFICKACYSSFYFAHRVLWFLKSLLNQEKIDKISAEKIKRIIYVIETIHLSDAQEKKHICEQYYINGNKSYTNYINNNSEQMFKLNIFRNYSSCSNAAEFSGNSDKLKLIDEKDVNLISFLSTINFIDSLCEISDRLKLINDSTQRKEEFNKELMTINNSLPLNVYIPFYNKNKRNYIISGISIPDCKIIKTKERAPFLITFECIRLDELCYILDSNNYIDRAIDYKFKDSSYSKIFKAIKKEVKSERDLQKIKHLLLKDDKHSEPIYVGNRKNLHYQSIKESNEIIINEEKIINEKEYQKIDQALKENNEQDNCIFNESSMSTTKANNRLAEEDIVENKKTRKISVSSSESSEEKSEEDKNESSTTNDISISTESEVINNSSSILKNEYDLIRFKEQTQNKALYNIFGETTVQLKNRLKKNSKYGNLLSFKPIQFMVKSGEDLRQEQFASQLINTFAQIFKLEKVDCYLYPYEIISTGTNSGIIELVENSMTLDSLKQTMNTLYPNYTLKDFYDSYFIKGTAAYKTAIKNLIQSLAGYSLICYFLQIKDRHNGNILIDNVGHLIHIDFGFIFSNSPGHEFETAPFKLTNEIVDVFGGVNSSNFQKFRKLMWKGMIAVSKHYQKILILVEMMYCGLGKKMDCFKDEERTLINLKSRFSPKDNMKKKDYMALVDSLIEKALSSWRTKWYDKYQYYFQGIFY